MLVEPLTCLQKTELVFKIIASAATSIALLVAAVWASFKFIRQRENHPLIDFTADITFHKKLGDWWIVELIAFIENKGKVQHRVKDFDFDLASLSGSDEVITSEEFGGQVHFPHLISKGSFRPKKYGEFFIEPGLKNKYSYITRVPVGAQVVILHTWFEYLDGKHSHSAEVTRRVPTKEMPEQAQVPGASSVGAAARAS
jgi:hypothetical protein